MNRPEQEEARSQRCPTCGGEVGWKDGKPFSKAEQELADEKRTSESHRQAYVLMQHREAAAVQERDRLRIQLATAEINLQTEIALRESLENAYDQGWTLGYAAAQEDQDNSGPLPNWGEDE